MTDLTVPKKKLTDEVATIARDPFIPHFSGRLLPQDDTLATRGQGKGLKIYDEIERDCHAYAVLHKRKAAVIARPWEVKPADESRRARQAADLVRAQLGRLNFDKLTYDLLDAILKGFAVAEILWEVDGAQLVARRAKVRAQRRFVFNEAGELRLLVQQNLFDGEGLPDRKFVVYAFGSKEESPYGLGLGTRLFWPSYFKRKGITFWLTFADKYGAPTALGKYPAGTEAAERERLLAALQALATDAGVAIPDTMAVEFIEAQRAGSIDTYDKLCRYMDDQMSLAVLGEILSTTPKGTGLGSGVADEQGAVRRELARFDADLLSSCLYDSLVTWIVELNMPGAPVPTVYRVMEDPEDLTQRVERDRKIYEMGFEPELEYIVDTYGGRWVKRAKALPPPFPPPGQDPGQEPPAPAFADDLVPADQAAIDELLDQLPASALQAQARAMLRPVIDMLETADGYQDALGRLAELYPSLDGSKLETMLGRAMFVAQTFGRAAADPAV